MSSAYKLIYVSNRFISDIMLKYCGLQQGQTGYYKPPAMPKVNGGDGPTLWIYYRQYLAFLQEADFTALTCDCKLTWQQLYRCARFAINSDFLYFFNFAAYFLAPL